MPFIENRTVKDRSGPADSPRFQTCDADDRSPVSIVDYWPWHSSCVAALLVKASSEAKRLVPTLRKSNAMSMQARSNLDNHTIARLRELTQLNIDSRDGFDYAAERIEDDAPQIANRFRELSDVRSRNAEHLEALLASCGDDAPESGTWTATMHRTWMNIRDMLSVKLDIYAVVAEAERGEDVIKQAYEEARHEFSGPVSTLINDQYNGVKQAHDSVRDLRDSLKP